jgi:hypothetical protein
MFEVVKGWGVWLETVEITDVTISSGALFKDLQANFRENMKRTAEMYRMNVESEVKVIQAAKQQEINIVLNANEKELNEYKNVIAMELTQINLEHTKRMALQDLEVEKVNAEYNLWAAQQA